MQKVSIVVPVYNVENYLNECMNSIVDQTLKEIEIICVNDGSTDNSAAILEEYARKDSRIKVIHKENGGYGSAINVGMEAAAGEYIGIVDSDDKILPEMYERLYAVAKESDLDVVKSDHYMWCGEKLYLLHNSKLNHYYDRVLENEYREVYFRFTMNTWTGIYKKEFIRNYAIRHNESPGASYQDNGFWFLTMALCKKAQWIGEAFYLHRLDNPASSTRSREKMMSMLNEYDFLANILLDRNLLEEYKICNYFRMSRHWDTFYRISDELKREYAWIIKKDYEKYKEKVNWEFDSESGPLLNWLDEISHNPEEFCDILIDKCSLLADLIRKSEHIIIYGAGKRAWQVYRKLLQLGQFQKVLFFAVTRLEEEKTFLGLPVRSAEDIAQFKNRALVLIGVNRTTGAFENVKNNLERLGIEEYFDTELMHAL